jgi:hypothetical protein
MDPEIYKPIRLNRHLKLNQKQKQIFEELATELKTIELHINYIDEIVARGGYILDVIFEAEPNDVDLFYSLKEHAICKCKEIKKEIKKLNLTLINSKKVDLGHILEGEIYFSPIEKVVGPFSHHIDIPSMICLDSKGNIWGNKNTLYCIQNKMHEINYLPWLMHFHFPYSPDNIYYRTFYTSYCRLSVRGLRMIFTKKYKRVGPNFKNHLANWPAVLKVIESNVEWKEAIASYIREKSPNMKLKDFKTAIDISKVKNKNEISHYLKNFF